MTARTENGLVPLIAIGTSAGGPGTLVKVLKTLPADLTCAVVILQHFDGQMTDNLLEWLSDHAPKKLCLAGNGEYLTAGEIYLSPSAGDLELSPSGSFRYLRGDLSSPYSPSIDRFFSSLVRYSAPVLAIIMTGMGEDGAKGLLQIRNAGGQTVAQDEASSVISGMPKAAVKIGAAQRVLNINEIGTAITNFNLYPRRLRHE